MNLDHVELIEAALDRGRAAAERHVGMIDAGPRAAVEHDPAPVARGEDVGQIAVGVEAAAAPESVVAQAREDHGLVRQALGVEPAQAPLQLDPRSLKLDHHAGIDREPARGPGDLGAGRAVIAADAAGDHEVFGDHVDDVGAREPCGHVELVERHAGIGLDLDEQAVDRVVEQPVAPDLRAQPAGRVFEAVGRGRDPGPGALPDPVEDDRGPGALELHRRELLEPGIDEHLPAAIADVGQADRAHEGPPGGGVGVCPEDDPAPLPTLDSGSDAVRVAADRVVVPGGEHHLPPGGAQHLDRGAGPRDRGGRTADVDDRGPQLDDGAGVDHHGHAGRHVERRPVTQRHSRQGGAHLVGQGRAAGAGGVADDPDDPLARVGVGGRHRGRDRFEGVGERSRPAADLRVRPIHEDRA